MDDESSLLVRRIVEKRRPNYLSHEVPTLC